jgi:hypothetical protein
LGQQRLGSGGVACVARGDQCCLGEITADVLMTCFICVLASRTLWVIAGSIVLANP